MLKKILHFIKYHNAFVIGLVLIFATSGFIFANDDLRGAVIGKAEVVRQGIDNSALLGAELDNFDFSMQITGVLEDPEPSLSASYEVSNQNYYVSYTYQTLAIRDNVWQTVTKEGTLTVSKAVLGGRDLGLYVAEELGEIIDSEIAYLKEVQQKEEQKGQTFVQETTKYTGLIGLVLNPVTKELPGYEPVVKPPAVVYTEPQPAPQPLQQPQPQPQPDQEPPAQSSEDNGASSPICGTCGGEPEPVATTSETTTTTTATTTESQATTTEATTTEPACQPSEEICDGVDNDCDGQIDEDLFQQCGSTDVGACQYGTQTCQAGEWGECQGAIEPTEEICGDNFDNNCDGQVDEGCLTDMATTTGQ